MHLSHRLGGHGSKADWEWERKGCEVAADRQNTMGEVKDTGEKDGWIKTLFVVNGN